MKLFKYSYALILFGSVQAFAATTVNPMAEVQREKMAKIVREAYVKAMNDNFVRIINLAKKEKFARDFLGEMAYLSKDHPLRKELAEAFQDAPSPKVISISDGLQFSVADQQFTITLNGKLGEVNVDGKPFARPKGSSWKDLINEDEKPSAMVFPILDTLLPKAHAGALKVLGQATWKAVKWATAGSAAGAAAGGVVMGTAACITAIHTKDDHETWDSACRESAAPAAAYGVVVGSGALGLGAGYVGFSEAIDDAKWTYNGKDDVAALKSGTMKVLKAVGSLGLLFTVAHLGAEALTINGAEVSCSNNNLGAYSIIGRYAGAKREIYTSDGITISRPGGCSYRRSYKYPGERDYYDTCSAMTKQEDVVKWMKGRYNTGDEQSSAVAKAVWAEHESMAETCKKNPGKTWKVMSTDTKQLTDGPPAKAIN